MVLVVDDNLWNRELVSVILKKAGFSVIEADTAEQGIEIARSRMPDLIIMDIFLPSMSGLEAVKILKSDTSTKHIPVIALTARAIKSELEQAIQAGCTGHITKPINKKKFLKEIQRLIE
ncbi:MAG: response regulator [Spirochaetota bacterium]